ncbi:mycofactocin biosynthesis glycosyltransferase MftF [Antrihabitans stalactiti]|uniref:Mycofactocin system glycosyltransferase n=1 Tax=Antrihabitans stalactiti TaxID=2584121 RepID=A0A848KJC6_9NOCA|nr:mycofactocin biosynthesis glycosyltransferase MftF [Antrihabitans stalactiti]NMN98805.1 mycofactocin system glycosyltransferase [Antrihabitans stalactiti]
MTNAVRLPDGFAVQCDPSSRAYSGGRVLIGGSPTTMLTLAPAAAAMLVDGHLEVTDPASAAVARRLLDSGVAQPRPTARPSTADVTIIIPVRNNPAGLTRLLDAVRGYRVIVVDDGSTVPVHSPRREVSVLRHGTSRGPAAARNTGLRSATTEFVAFLDSDVIPREGWLRGMLGHFDDPTVALVAPRIVAFDPDSTALARYEHSRSSLDLGRRESRVRAGSIVSYVPSAAMLVRRRVIADEGGFDETMTVAEDVDLCWRLERAGWSLRYEPTAQVAHDHRITIGKWFSRRLFYGTGAALLAERHTDAVAPVAMPVWTAAAVGGAATLTRVGFAGAVVSMAVATVRLRKVFTGLDQPTSVAAQFAVRGFAAAVGQVASAACRDYWPVTAVAMACSRRFRRVVIATAVAEGVADWCTHRQVGGLDPVRYVWFKRLDDLAYGTGLWRGAARARSVAALTPNLRR